MTAATINKPPTEQKVLAAASVAEGATVDQVAADAGIGRTSARKYLAALEQAGTLKRVPGGRDGKRKLPDRYLVQKEARASAGTKEGDHKDQVERLRPGGLDELVLGYMRERDQDAPFSPSAVAKGLGRSSGAVANCLQRLVSAEKAELVSAKPRRYAVKPA